MDPILEVEKLNSYYTDGRSLFGAGGMRRQVLRDVSFSIRRGETLGLVGESGSGKNHPVPCGAWNVEGL